MKIVDIHCHLGNVLPHDGGGRGHGPSPWSPGWVMDLTGYLAYRSLPGLHSMLPYVDKKQKLELARTATLDNLLRSSIPYGIAVSVLQPVEPARPTADNLEAVAEYKSSWRMSLASTFTMDKIAREGGVARAALELADNAEPPHALMTFASVHPLDPDKEKKLGEYIRAGCAGLKLHPITQDLRPEDPAWFDTLELWRKTGKPALIHSGISGLFRPRSRRDGYGDAARYGRLVEAFPDVPIILAHMNMMRSEVVWDLAAKHDNVFTDLSFHGPAKIREARNRMGAGRLLFGSDFPFTKPGQAVKAGLDATSDDPEFRRMFFRGNAAALLGVGENGRE